MLLKDHLVRQGAFLFRWRGVLPLLLVVLAVVALPQSTYLENRFGTFVEQAFEMLGFILAFSGLALRVATVGFVPTGTSGRNTRKQRADTLNTTGLYSVVRNPLYLGNIITLLGFLMAVKVWWLVPGGLAISLLYYERIILAEETYLMEKFGPADYGRWAVRTPALIPDLRLWQRPGLPFSFKTVLRREYYGFYVIVLVMTAIELLTDLMGEGQPLWNMVNEDPALVALFIVGSLAFLTVRLIHKKTAWLVVHGR